MSDRYRVVRETDQGNVVVFRGLTLRGARAWCELPWTEGGSHLEWYEREE